MLDVYSLDCDDLITDVYSMSKLQIIYIEYMQFFITYISTKLLKIYNCKL